MCSWKMIGGSKSWLNLAQYTNQWINKKIKNVDLMEEEKGILKSSWNDCKK